MSASGGHAFQPIETIELLFQHSGDALLHHLSPSRRKIGAHTDACRSQWWKILEAKPHKDTTPASSTNRLQTIVKTGRLRNGWEMDRTALISNAVADRQ